MALALYESVDSATEYSSGGLYTDPLIVSLDGRTGGVVEKLLYVRNDDVTREYSSITLSFNQSGGSISYVDGSSGFSMKAKAGSTHPTPAEWVTISADNTVSLADISDTATYLPVWVRFEFPPKISVQHISNVSIKFSATESVA